MGKSTSNIHPLSDLEMYELIYAAYPEKFRSIEDEDECMDAVINYIEDTYGFDDLADLLGRVVMMSYPLQSSLSKKHYHTLGTFQLSEDKKNIVIQALVKREYK